MVVELAYLLNGLSIGDRRLQPSDMGPERSANHALPYRSLFSSLINSQSY